MERRPTGATRAETVLSPQSHVSRSKQDGCHATADVFFPRVGRRLSGVPTSHEYPLWDLNERQSSEPVRDAKNAIYCSSHDSLAQEQPRPRVVSGCAENAISGCDESATSGRFECAAQIQRSPNAGVCVGRFCSPRKHILRRFGELWFLASGARPCG